jgi:hypothetical protein
VLPLAERGSASQETRDTRRDEGRFVSRLRIADQPSRLHNI